MSRFISLARAERFNSCGSLLPNTQIGPNSEARATNLATRRTFFAQRGRRPRGSGAYVRWYVSIPSGRERSCTEKGQAWCPREELNDAHTRFALPFQSNDSIPDLLTPPPSIKVLNARWARVDEFLPARRPPDSKFTRQARRDDARDRSVLGFVHEDPERGATPPAGINFESGAPARN